MLTKNRSLVKSKFRKGSLSRTDETYLSLVNPAKEQVAAPVQQQAVVGQGSTALNYSNSTVSQSNCSQGNPSSRKSLISNPINFQHLQHMGPNDGKSFMTTDQPTSGLPPTGSSARSGSAGLNVSLAESNTAGGKKPSTATNNRPIAKKEISAPTNFRHVVRGLEEFGFNSSVSEKSAKNGNQQSSSSSRIPAQSANPATAAIQAPNVPPPPLPTQQQQQHQNHLSIKSSSLSSSSSSSSSILHSPHSPTSSNHENLSQAISNTLKANSVLYNGNHP